MGKVNTKALDKTTNRVINVLEDADDAAGVRRNVMALTLALCSYAKASGFPPEAVLGAVELAVPQVWEAAKELE